MSDDFDPNDPEMLEIVRRVVNARPGELQRDAREARRRERAAAVPQGRVYFVQCMAEDRPVEIGTAMRDGVGYRMADLQVGNPFELRLLGTMPGGYAKEAELHRRFAHLRIRGEWFRSEPELLAVVDTTMERLQRP